MKKQFSHFMNLHAREIRAFFMLMLIFAIGLISCKNESVLPQQIDPARSIDSNNTFAVDDDSTSLKPPKEPSGGGNGGG